MLNLINPSLHNQLSFIVYVWSSFILFQFKNKEPPGTHYLVFLISEICEVFTINLLALVSFHIVFLRAICAVT